MCMHVSLHVCLGSEEGEKGVESHGIWVIDGLGKQRQEDFREFKAVPKQSKPTSTASCGVSPCNSSWEGGDRWAILD